MRVLALALALWIAVSPLAAQTSIPEMSETIEVAIVNVDVFVTDEKGNRVRGLKRDDFEIREDGKPRPITNFAEYDREGDAGTFAVEPGAAKPPRNAAAERVAPAEKRTIVIFVEEMHLPNARMREVFGALREFVRGAVRPGDAAAVVSWNKAVDVRQDFTDDLESLEAALTELEETSVGVQIDYGAMVRAARAADAAWAMGRDEGNVATVGGGGASMEMLERRALEHFELNMMRRKAVALTSLIQSMSGIDGKKIMLMAMHRFGIHPGFEYSADVRVANFAGNVDTDPLRAKVVDTANANGVTLYPFYPSGLAQSSVGGAEERRPNVSTINSDLDAARAGMDNAILMNETTALSEIAEETGGLMAYGPGDIASFLPRVTDDLDSYYSLAFRATHSGRDGARRIVVTTKNRDYVVRTRHAIVEKSETTQMNDRVTANLFQTLEHSVIPIEVETGEIRELSRKRREVALMVKVPISALTTRDSDGGVTGTFSVFIASGGEFGVISEVQKQSQPYTIRREDLERANGSHFTYEVKVEVGPAADRISVGVLDEVSKEFGLARVEMQR